MQNLKFAAALSEGQATNIIFDACRANETRATWSNGKFEVKFDKVTMREYESTNADHRATVFDANGFIVATAYVDRHDC